MENCLMCFASAINLLKTGRCMERISIPNKKIELVKGNYAVNTNPDHHIKYINDDLFQLGDYGTTSRTPHFRVTNNGINTEGWQPTEQDMLAEDWREVREY